MSCTADIRYTRFIYIIRKVMMIHTRKSLKCTEQAKEFLKYIENMASRPQEYVIHDGKGTTNNLEGFHGLALKSSIVAKE